MPREPATTRRDSFGSRRDWKPSTNVAENARARGASLLGRSLVIFSKRRLVASRRNTARSEIPMTAAKIRAGTAAPRASVWNALPRASGGGPSRIARSRKTERRRHPRSARRGSRPGAPKREDCVLGPGSQAGRFPRPAPGGLCGREAGRRRREGGKKGDPADGTQNPNPRRARARNVTRAIKVAARSQPGSAGRSAGRSRKDSPGEKESQQADGQREREDDLEASPKPDPLFQGVPLFPREGDRVRGTEKPLYTERSKRVLALRRPLLPKKMRRSPDST